MNIIEVIMDIILENLFVGRDLYTKMLSSLCAEYGFTLSEILVLLFLANNPEYDTAKDIAEKLKLAKSHVSVSVRNLEENGYIKGSFSGANHRTIHLVLCEKSSPVVSAARQRIEDFKTVVMNGFESDEQVQFKDYLKRVTDNIKLYIKEN